MPEPRSLFVGIVIGLAAAWAGSVLLARRQSANAKAPLKQLPKQAADYDPRSELRRYVFEYDRIQHMRLTFMLAIHAVLLVAGGNAASDRRWVAGAISILGLVVLIVGWTAIANLDNRIQWANRALGGDAGEDEEFVDAVHQRWFQRPGKPTVTSDLLLIRIMPLVLAAAYLLLLSCAAFGWLRS